MGSRKKELLQKFFIKLRKNKILKKLTDRIENANETFVVEGATVYNNVLLIDDAVGSGASINQVAQKIKEKGLAKKVIGFAITGSLNDFDVISET